ncbi:hypothetical protein GGF46_003303 [Coemansia sp. RSA 552]|nr:hypothetical protein GGF46_003303 [Coemansia sp. RSA 552]
MIRRKKATEAILPDVPHPAFAYRPYRGGLELGEDLSSSDDETGSVARVVERRGTGDHRELARQHARSAYGRIREARRLVDDSRFEYACDVVFECQRGFNFLGKASFSTKLLHPMDPPPWSDATMKLTVANVHSFQLVDPSWEWVSPRWLIDMTLDVDEDGWQYSSRFSGSSQWHSNHAAAKSFVRRRRWLRLRRRLVEDEGGEEESSDGWRQIGPGDEQLCNYDRDKVVKRTKSSRPKDVASKIKSKVSRNYVGRSPREPQKAPSRQMAYTLKDGRYRSHRASKDGMPTPTQSSSTYSADTPVALPPVPAALSPVAEKPVDLSPVAEGSVNPSSVAEKPTSLSTVAEKPMSLSTVAEKPMSLSTVAEEPRKRHDSGSDPAPAAGEGHLHPPPALQRRASAPSHQHKSSWSSSLWQRSGTDELALALPTGGMAIEPRPTLALTTAAPSMDSDEGHWRREGPRGYVDGVPERFPRLRGLMPPEPTVPQGEEALGTVVSSGPSSPDSGSSSRVVITSQHTPDRSVLGDYVPANAQDQESVAAKRGRRSHTLSLRPVASAIWTGLGSRHHRNAALAAAQSLPVSPQRSTMPQGSQMVQAKSDLAVPELPGLPALSEGVSSTMGGSTAVDDSHLSLVLRGPVADNDDDDASVPHTPVSRRHSSLSLGSRLPRTPSRLSQASSGNTSIDFGPSSALPGQQQGPSYVDPYAGRQRQPQLSLLQAPSHQRTLSDGAGGAVDRGLAEMAQDTLQSMLSDLGLDRERLEFIQGCLRLGGITAASVWYCLPWLHFEALQFDDARQRLISLLLAYAPTCPVDALRIFGASSSYRVSERAALARMASRERDEYLGLLHLLDAGRAVEFTPSQAWRFVVRPLVERDADLFYSDFKLMVVGVARWSLAQRPAPSTAA